MPAAALASAVNDWQIAEWLEPEPRLRASIVVPSQQPELAAREIDRVGGHPGFVQVFLPVRSAMPYGNRRYHPIYEAAVRHDLSSASTSAARRQPADARRLAVLLPGGVRRHGPGLPVPAHSA